MVLGGGEGDGEMRRGMGGPVRVTVHVGERCQWVRGVARVGRSDNGGGAGI